MQDGGADLDLDSRNMLTEPENRAAREGVFDAQLSFPAPFVEAPSLITSIVKRDGRTVPFETSKIADAIFRAAQSIGGHDRDRATSLASGVTIYLSKRLEGSTPTVDHVHDAVEKVLIEMGHAKTALAYARYRDKRARLRRLRGGDIRGILRELEEARHEADAVEYEAGRPLFVRTSDERLDGWDRERIVSALTRETGIAAGLARVIAIEVEEQVSRAKVETLTASLVRELVDAKLVEHGLEEYRSKHMRLGVPLFDAERIVCAPNQGEFEGIYDPSRTDITLAERVKKEFALTQVFSRETADAHLKGDLHIHDLGCVDRLHSGHHSLECVKRFGLPFSAGERYAPLPLNAEMLVVQAAQFNAALHRHFTRDTNWDAFNLRLAPFLGNSDARHLRQLAHLLVFGLTHLMRVSHRSAACTGLSLVWTVPPGLRDVEAVGPGGLPTGRTYMDYLPDARRLAWELLDVFKESRTHPCSEADWAPLIHVSDEFFTAPGHSEFLAYTLNDPCLRSRLRFVFDRDENAAAVDQRWTARRVTVQEVSVNLPRAAYRGKGMNGLMSEIERVVNHAVRAHAEKRRFIDRLLAFRDVGPLSLLTFGHEGKPYFDADQAKYRIGIAGLNDCVQSITGHELRASGEAVEAGLQIVRHIRECAARAADNEFMQVEIGASDTSDVARRFAMLDLHQYPEEARAVVKTDVLTQDAQYTPGVRPSAAHRMNPIDRARTEGLFHDLLDADTETTVKLADSDFGPESIAQFVEKVFHLTRVRRLALLPTASPY